MSFLAVTEQELMAISLSLKVAMLSTTIALPLAVWLGYVLSRKEFYGKAIIDSVLHLPLVMPPVTTGFLLLLIFGKNGIVGSWLYETLGVQLAFHFNGAVLASLIVSFPLLVRSVRTSIDMIDSGLEEASYILGASPLKTFFRITLPLAMPGVVSGAVLAFARSLGEFGATITFAGNIAGETQTIPLAIYSYMQVPDSELYTLRLVVVSIVIAFVAMAVSELYLRKSKKA